MKMERHKDLGKMGALGEITEQQPKVGSIVMADGHYDLETYIALISEDSKVVVIPFEPENTVDNAEKGEQRSMALYFINNYSTQVSIVIIWREPRCDRGGGSFEKTGWLNLNL